MIPLRDVIPSRTVPYLTVSIIVLNALAWFYELGLPREDLPVFSAAVRGRSGVFRAADAHQLDVPARQLVARARQHVVPVDFWRQRRRSDGPFPVPDLLSPVRHRRRTGPDLHRSDVDAADDWRERRNCWRDGRVLRSVSAVARADIDSADRVLGDRGVARDLFARLLVPDAAVQRWRDCRHGQFSRRRRGVHGARGRVHLRPHRCIHFQKAPAARYAVGVTGIPIARLPDYSVTQSIRWPITSRGDHFSGAGYCAFSISVSASSAGVASSMIDRNSFT